MAARTVSPTHTGFYRNVATGRLEIYYKGALVGQANGTDFGMIGAVATTTLASTTTITAGTGIVATTTLTAGTGVTVTTGNMVVAAGDVRNTAANLRLGAVETFAMTEPTSAVVMKTGTAPVGTITTSGGIFSTTTVINKIVAGGTADNIGTA